MAGYPPGDFDETVLTVTPDIVRQGQPTPELFDLSVTFDGYSAAWDTAEWVSDPTGLDSAQYADIRWFLESIGPGAELVVALDSSERLMIGGGPYTVTVTGIDPDATFTQPDGTTATIDKGIYRVQCRVDVAMGPNFWTGYFSGDVLLRVA